MRFHGVARTIVKVPFFSYEYNQKGEKERESESVCIQKQLPGSDAEEEEARETKRRMDRWMDG